MRSNHLVGTGGRTHCRGREQVMPGICPRQGDGGCRVGAAAPSRQVTLVVIRPLSDPSRFDNNM
jgi:hypothetical protein